METENELVREDARVDRKALLRGLDRLAFYFETSDPHLRHEAHIVAKQNLSQVAREVTDER